MSAIPTIDLSALPPPDVVQTLDFEAIYQALLVDFRTLFPDYTAVLESDPFVKLLELAAYRELLLRARVNDAARSNLLAFSGGSDLDHLAAFYGVLRMPDETDARFRLRTQLQIAAIAGNGTRERYRAIALQAHAAVRDAAVLQPAAGQVDLALWITDLPGDTEDEDYPAANAAHHATVLAAVTEAFAADDARMLGVPLTVREAVPVAINVTASIWRESSAPVDLAAQLQAALPAAIASYSKLGRDLSRSWLFARLHVAGVSHVELLSPSDDLVLAPDAYAIVGEIAVSDAGVNW